MICKCFASICFEFTLGKWLICRRPSHLMKRVKANDPRNFHLNFWTSLCKQSSASSDLDSVSNFQPSQGWTKKSVQQNCETIKSSFNQDLWATFGFNKGTGAFLSKFIFQWSLWLHRQYNVASICGENHPLPHHQCEFRWLKVISQSFWKKLLSLPPPTPLYFHDSDLDSHPEAAACSSKNRNPAPCKEPAQHCSYLPVWQQIPGLEMANAKTLKNAEI